MPSGREAIDMLIAESDACIREFRAEKDPIKALEAGLRAAAFMDFAMDETIEQIRRQANERKETR